MARVAQPSDLEDSEVGEFLARLARAMSSGDDAAFSAMWQVPAFVMEEEAVRALGSRAEIEGFSSTVRAAHEERGITTRAEMIRLEWLTERVATVDVRWSHLDARGIERGSETSTLLVRRDDAGELRVCVSLSRGATSRH